MRRALLTLLAALGLLAATGAATAQSPSAGEPPAALVEQGRQLYVEACSACHGVAGAGVDERGPSLFGAGAASADFYLRTGRMPLGNPPGSEPLRAESPYTPEQIDALVAYVSSLAPGLGYPIPDVDPARGDVAAGKILFTDNCAGCHQVAGEGGVVTGDVAPPLDGVDPVTVAEAIRVGPYTMPVFPETVLSDDDVDSIAAYVELLQDPDDPGGAGLGHIGPVPEGMVAWFAGLAALLLIARLIGERTRR